MEISKVKKDFLNIEVPVKNMKKLLKIKTLFE